MGSQLNFTLMLLMHGSVRVLAMMTKQERFLSSLTYTGHGQGNASSVSSTVSQVSGAVSGTELVVAVCTEDLSWIDEAASEFTRVTVYDKCSETREEQQKKMEADRKTELENEERRYQDLHERLTKAQEAAANEENNEKPAKLVQKIQHLMDDLEKEKEKTKEEYDKSWQDTLISFSAANVQVQRLQNIGSCDFAFLTYIIDRWDSLPDIVEFTKGAPSNRRYRNHGNAPLQCMSCDGTCDRRRLDNVRCENAKIGSTGGNGKVVERGFNMNLQFDFTLSHHGFFNNDGETTEYHRSGYKNMGDWIDYASKVSPLSRDVYTDACCARNYGGHFAVKREQIINEAYFQGRTRELYVWLREQQHYANEEVDHYIERTWWAVFCADKEAKFSACDWQCYLDWYRDLQETLGESNTAAAEAHYRAYGESEGRRCTCPGPPVRNW